LNNFSETIPVSKAKTSFSELLKRIKEHHESFAITQRGKIEGVLIGIDEYESLLETLEILSDPDLMGSIQRGLDDERRERLHSHKEIF
jgi:prevent-host-death family protein